MRALSSARAWRISSPGLHLRPLSPPTRTNAQDTLVHRFISTRQLPSLRPLRLTRHGPLFSRHNASMSPPSPPPSTPPQSSLAPPRAMTPISPNSPFSRRHPLVAFTVRLGMSSVVGVVLIVGIILAHDAFTYSERHADRVPAQPLSLHPRAGGKKNLPIIESNLDDEQDETMRSLKDKPRLVIVGGGWGVSHSSSQLKSSTLHHS